MSIQRLKSFKAPRLAILKRNGREMRNEELHIPMNSSPFLFRKKCVACFDLVTRNDPVTPCAHPYHVECLTELFTIAMQDESLMPPRCCGQAIPVALAKLTIPKTIEFNAKLLEFSTTNRLYCHRSTCSAFIPPARIANSVGTCPK